MHNKKKVFIFLLIIINFYLHSQNLKIYEERLRLKDQSLIKELEKADPSLKSIIIKALYSDNIDFQTTAIIALGKLKDKSQIKKITSLIDSKAWGPKYYTLWYIGELKASEYLGLVENALDDPEWTIRVMAYDVIVKLQKEASIVYLIKGVKDDNKNVANKIIKSLIKFYPYAKSYIKNNLFVSENPEERIRAVKILSMAKKDDNTEYFIEALKDKNLDVVKEAVNVLYKKKKMVLGVFLQNLPNDKKMIILNILEKNRDSFLLDSILKLGKKTQNKEIIKKILDILGELKNTKSTSFVKKFIEDEDFLLRSTALWVLSEFKDYRNLPIFFKKLKDPNWQVRCAAISSLGKYKYSRKICKELFKKINDPNENVRYSVISQLGKFRYSHVLPHLHKILRENKESPSIIAVSCKTLGLLKFSNSIPLLLEKLYSPHSEVTKYSNWALNNYGKEATPFFLAILKDKNRKTDLRYRMVLFFARNKDNSTISYLINLAKDKQEDFRIRATSISLLAQFQEKKSIPIVIDSLKDANPLVKKSAILAVGKFKLEKQLPYLFKILENPENKGVSEAALWSIKEFGKLSFPLIMENLKKQDCIFLYDLLRLINILKMKQAMPLLLKIGKRIASSKEKKKNKKLLSGIAYCLYSFYKTLDKNDFKRIEILKFVNKNKHFE